VRRNILILAVAVVVLTVVFFFILWNPQTSRIDEARQRADTEEQNVNTLRVELARLQALQKDAPALREQAAKFEAAMPSDPHLAEFILMVQDAANASGIDWVSVSPTPPAAGTTQGVSVIAIQMNVNGGYFQVQDFLVRLESLERAVKIGTVNLGPGPGGLPQLAISLAMQMFVSTPGQAALGGTAPAQPAPQQSPAASQSPAPGQSPQAAPSPSP
jgi:Tfp pilus assembly protein PilO